MLKYLSIALTVLTLASCGGGGSSPTTPPPTGGGPPPTGTLTGDLQVTTLPPPSKLSATPGGLESFVAFESGHVRPLALSDDGQSLYVVNTADNRLEILSVNQATLTLQQSVPVGMEPVAVATRGNEVWVVNHLSDSVSIIDTSFTPARVTRTLLVGDEPRDILFAGANFNRAFITTAHRGQHSPVDAQTITPGVGRADVWVFDRTNPGTQLGGAPETVVTLFGDTPRALAATNDGARVYAAVLNSGNQTTAIRSIPTIDKAAPFANIAGREAPKSALILKFNGTDWVDEAGRQYNNRAALTLPDLDVFEIDAMAATPRATNDWAGVGTTLFNMAVNPQSGDVWVSNTEARNHIRFEGPGSGGTTVRAHVAENRLSQLSAGGNVVAHNLNSHIDRSRQFGTSQERDAALSQPLELKFSDDASKLYVVAMGSNKIGVLDVASLESGSFDPTTQTHITVSGGGPTGIVLDSARQQAYVTTRYDNGVSVLDLNNHTEIGHMTLPNPEPDSVKTGRPFLYDATLTSSNGESACASCHIFGDTDHLAWDLGNPDEVEKTNPFGPVPFTNPPSGEFTSRNANFHPMKGPKGTQSLRGMANHGPLHWRGDRTGENPVNGETREEASFKEFNAAFDVLLGRDGPIDEQDMQAFTDFAIQLSYPPNPHRAIDNSFTPDQREGHRVYTRVFTSPGGTVGCNTCHILDPANGRFGTADTFIAVLGENSQDFKVPHFRNLYQKIGFFRGGSSPQVRGFGLSEPASSAGIMALVNSGDFRFETNAQPEQLAAFLLAYDSLLAPIVGQQITLSENSPASTEARIDVLVDRALTLNPVVECDLIVKGVWNLDARGAVMRDNSEFQTDRSTELLTLPQLITLGRSPDNHLTFTCVPPNSGERMGIDRDENGVFDGDEP